MYTEAELAMLNDKGFEDFCYNHFFDRFNGLDDEGVEAYEKWMGDMCDEEQFELWQAYLKTKEVK